VFYQEEVSECESYWQCIMFHIISGLSNDGVGTAFGNIPEAMIPPSFINMFNGTDNGRLEYAGSDNDVTMGRTLWIFIFFIFWVIILQGIITGLIVDAFSSLREEQISNAEDLEDKCFVCSKDRLAFDRNGGFDLHINSDHNRWNYLAFIILLRYAANSFFVPSLPPYFLPPVFPPCIHCVLLCVNVVRRTSRR
jgi:hypothetical protein